MRASQWAGVVILGAAACAAVVMALGSFPGRRAPSTPLPAADSRTLFAQSVVPVLDRRCGTCHGVPAASWEEFRREPLNLALLRWPVNDAGQVADAPGRELAWRACTETVVSGAHVLTPIDRESPPLASSLLRAPLSESLGGRVHPEIFTSLADADFAALSAWVTLELASTSRPPAQLRPGAETAFAERVVPVLERKTCFGSNCHGSLAFNDLKLDPGIPALPGRFTPAIHRANRKAMLGNVTRLVNLSGDVEKSKQLRKSIPVEKGGIIHKGGNNFLSPGDPDYLVLRDWLLLERAEAEAAVATRLGVVDGTIFLRRPRASPERALEPLAWIPGGDLIWKRGAVETNLTAALHPDGPADIRAADVSYDGRRIVFAMRRSEAEPFNVWELELDGGAARPRTFSRDPEVHFIDPCYVPDPEDAAGADLSRADLVVLSNAAGEICDVSPDGVLGEGEGGSADEIRDEELTEARGTFDGRRIRVVRGTNRGEARRVLRQEAGVLRVDVPFPAPCDTTTHYVIDSPVRTAPRFDLYRLPFAPPGDARPSYERRSRMTWSPSQARGPFPRSSGEIMATFLRSGRQNGRPFFNGAIFRTHVDGSNFHTHAANRSGVPLHVEGREGPDGLEVRIGRDADSWWGGIPILSDHQFGPPVEERNPLDDLDHPGAAGAPKTALTQFSAPWVSLDATARHRGVSPGGAWHDLTPLPDGSLLASFAPGPIDLNDPGAAPDFDILRLVPDPAFQSADGRPGGTFRREPVAGGPLSELWPRPVCARLKESHSKRLKTETSLFGPGATERGLSIWPAGTPATLQVFDLVLLDAFFAQSTPVGVRHLGDDVCPSCGDAVPPEAQVRFARIVGLEPRRDGAEPRRLLIAELPVERDGSIHALVPSGMPFDIESLNADRMALRSPNRWLYALPGEKHTLSIPRALYAQTCGGCHGGLTGAPADVLRRPDIVTSASRTQAIWDTRRFSRVLPANWIGGRAPDAVPVGFEADVRPVLRRSCVSCHSAGGPGPDLAGPGAREALACFLDADDPRAVAAPLLEKLDGREHLAAGTAPAAPHAPLSADDRLTLIRWIDLGAGR